MNFRFLHAAVTALQETQNTVLRVFAVKSLFWYIYFSYLNIHSTGESTSHHSTLDFDFVPLFS